MKKKIFITTILMSIIWLMPIFAQQPLLDVKSPTERWIVNKNIATYYKEISLFNTDGNRTPSSTFYLNFTEFDAWGRTDSAYIQISYENISGSNAIKVAAIPRFREPIESGDAVDDSITASISDSSRWANGAGNIANFPGSILTDSLRGADQGHSIRMFVDNPQYSFTVSHAGAGTPPATNKSKVRISVQLKK